MVSASWAPGQLWASGNVSPEHSWVVAAHQHPRELALGFQELQGRNETVSKQPLGAGPLARGLPAWSTGLPAGCWAFGVIPHKHLLGPGSKVSAWPLVQAFLSGGCPEGTALRDCVQPGHRVSETCRCLPASPGERPQSPWGGAWLIVGAQ